MQKQQRSCHPGPLDVETLNFSLGVNSLKWNIWGFGLPMWSESSKCNYDSHFLNIFRHVLTIKLFIFHKKNPHHRPESSPLLCFFTHKPQVACVPWGQLSYLSYGARPASPRLASHAAPRRHYLFVSIPHWVCFALPVCEWKGRAVGESYCLFVCLLLIFYVRIVPRSTRLARL